MNLTRFQVSEDFRSDGEPVFAVWRLDGEEFFFPRWEEGKAIELCELLNGLIKEIRTWEEGEGI